MASREFVHTDIDRTDHSHVSAQFRFIKRSASLEYSLALLRANVFHVKVSRRGSAPLKDISIALVLPRVSPFPTVISLAKTFSSLSLSLSRTFN